MPGWDGAMGADPLYVEPVEVGRRDVSITLADCHGELTLPDVLFATPLERWLAPETIPSLPLRSWDAWRCLGEARILEPTVPILYGDREFRAADDRIRLPLDVFGSAFFLLTRYEEAVLKERDEHDRVPGRASIAVRAGFIERPLVNEYLELLWAAMKRLWPRLERARRRARILVSCDVDWPYSRGAKSLWAAIRQAGGDIVKRRSLWLAARSMASGIASRWGRYDLDPNNTFEWIMDVNERAGNAVTFHFLAGRTDPRYDGIYDLSEPWIRSLLRRIRERGHHLALHPSYGT